MLMAALPASIRFDAQKAEQQMSPSTATCRATKALGDSAMICWRWDRVCPQSCSLRHFKIGEPPAQLSWRKCMKAG